jgi:hypothetical protein
MTNGQRVFYSVVSSVDVGIGIVLPNDTHAGGVLARGIFFGSATLFALLALRPDNDNSKEGGGK